jgi:uroporphyrinogen-III synthase
VEVPVATLAALPVAIEAGEVAAMTFCSPSSARSVARVFDAALVALAGRTSIAVLGKTTARAVEDLGGRVDVVARRPEPEVLAEDLAHYLAARDKGAS